MLGALRKRLDYTVGVIASIAFAVVSIFNLGPFTLSDLEVAGFITGAWAVWLAAKNNVWNWPMAIVNGAIFVALFIEFKLYADAGINMWYVVAGLYGWWFWLKGGASRTERPIGHIPLKELGIVIVLTALATWFLRERLIDLGGSAPFLDAITASMSFAAFWMMTRRYIENWFVWILADIIYIPLYFWKDLPLTGVLYIVFMAMCFVGLKRWRADLKAREVKPMLSDWLIDRIPLVGAR